MHLPCPRRLLLGALPCQPLGLHRATRKDTSGCHCAHGSAPAVTRSAVTAQQEVDLDGTLSIAERKFFRGSIYRAINELWLGSSH